VAVDPSAPGTAAFSTAQEEATIEAKIEDFVAGASSDPTTPGEISTLPGTPEPATPVTTPPPTPIVEPPASDTTDSDADTKTPADKDKKTPEDTDTTRKKVITPTSHDKPKTDINTLAALEEAVEKQSAGTPPIAAIVSDENGPPSAPVIQPTATTAKQSADITAAAAAPVAGTILTPPVDPNTIAL
jgi:hypothetical protein